MEDTETSPIAPVIQPLSLRAEVAAFTVLAATGELSFFHLVIFSRLRSTVGDYVNNLLCNFILEHGYLWVLRRPDHAVLWDPPIYFPARNTAVFAESLLGSAPVYWLWRACGLAPATAYQLWQMSLPLLGFAVAFILLRFGLRLGAIPSLVGAYICAYGSVLAGQVNNPQLHTMFFTYGALALLCVLIRSDRPRPLVAAGVACALLGQLLACFYLGWLAVFFLGVAVALSLLLPELRPRLLRALRLHYVGALGGATVAALALWPIVHRSLAVVRTAGWTGQGAAAVLPQAASWLYPGRRSVFYFWWGRLPIFASLPGEPEQRLALGLVTLCCAAAGLWLYRRDPWVRLTAFIAIAIIVFTTELPGGVSAWHLVRGAVPGAATLRIVPRAGVLLLLPAGVGVALFLSSRSRTPLLLIALLLAEQAYSEYTFSKVKSEAIISSFAAAVDAACPAAYLAVDQESAIERTPHWVLGAEIMMAQTMGRIPFVNGGYSRFVPPGYGPLAVNTIADDGDRGRLVRGLEQWVRSHGLTAADVCWVETVDPHQHSLRSEPGATISDARVVPVTSPTGWRFTGASP